MAKKIKSIIVIALLAVIMILSYSVYVQINTGKIASVTQYQNKLSFSGNSLASVVSTAGLTVSQNGDVYYQKICEDVSPYLAKGEVSLGKDGDGCQISGAPTVLSSQDIGQRIGSFCHGGSYNRCGSGCTTGRDVCAETFGSTWSGSCGGSPSNNQFKTVICSLNGYVKHGGLVTVENKCTYETNQLLAGETFNSGSTITKLSTRYPVAGFCLAHPAIVTDANLKQSVSSTNVYEDLQNGKSITVPAGQTITLFYIVNNNKNLPTVCDSTQNLALDANSNVTVCKSTLGFTYLCSQGVFDSKSGTCVVQPETAKLCTQGRYDIALDKCVYNPPIQYDCGSVTATYDVDRNVCVEYVKDEFTCKDGATLYKPSQTECSQNGGVWQNCPQCPDGKVCPVSICEARCSVGIACVTESPVIEMCKNANATISSSGKCVIYNEEVPQTIQVCPSNTKYDKSIGKCVEQYETIQTCSDGTEPTINPITTQKECVVTVTKFKSCPATQVYDQVADRCADSVQITTATSAPVLYQEVRNGCTTDFGCDTGLVCNTQLNICQTPIKVGTDWQTVGKFAFIIVALGAILYFIVRKKKR